MARLAECRRRADEEASRLSEETSRVRRAAKVRAQAASACADALRRAGEAVQKAGREAELSCGELSDALSAADPLHETAACEPAFSAAGSAVAAARDERMSRTYEARQRATDAATAVEEVAQILREHLHRLAVGL